jgi:hypothetical protein
MQKDGCARRRDLCFFCKAISRRPSGLWLATAVILCVFSQGQTGVFAQTDPRFTLQPVGATVMAGSNVTFEVAAIGEPPLMYYWQHGFQYLPNSDTNTLTLTNVQLSDAGCYIATVYNSNEYVQSDPAILVVLQAPLIVSSPVGQTVIAGSNATMSVNATAYPPPSYQWFIGGAPLPGATNAELDLTDVQAANVGDYTVVVSNYINTATSLPAHLSVTAIGPVISPDLSDRVAISETEVALAPPIYGSDPRTYEWKLNGSVIPGATNASLIFTSIQPASAGKYNVTVANSLGSATSRVATLTVKKYPLPSTIVAWGDNTYGQTNLPSGETNVVGLASSPAGSVFLRQDGTMGSIGYEIVSPGTFSVLPPMGEVTLYAGDYALALASDGTPVAYGVTYYSGASDVPAGVTNAIDVAAGNPRLALLSDGTVVGWNPRPSFEVPDPGKILPSLSSLSNITAISMCNYHLLALKNDGTVVALGENGSGQSTVPVGLNNVVAVSAGANHSLALKSNGKVVAWGDNTYGQTNVPAGLSGVAAISAGYNHNLALESNGVLVAWGDNTYGQCNIPAGLSNVVYVSAGASHSVVLTKQPGQCITPSDQAIFAGGNSTFNFLASGYQPISYQWECNGTNVTGATNTVLALTDVPLADAGVYQCVASNAFGVALSSPAVLTVSRQPPLFSTVPSGFGFTNGGFQLSLSQLSGHGNVIIETSTNLIDWQPVYTNAPVLGSLQYRDVESSNFPARFYRAFEE